MKEKAGSWLKLGQEFLKLSSGHQLFFQVFDSHPRLFFGDANNILNLIPDKSWQGFSKWWLKKFEKIKTKIKHKLLFILLVIFFPHRPHEQNLLGSLNKITKNLISIFNINTSLNNLKQGNLHFRWQFFPLSVSTFHIERGREERNVPNPWTPFYFCRSWQEPWDLRSHCETC